MWTQTCDIKILSEVISVGGLASLLDVPKFTEKVAEILLTKLFGEV
jgi:hypothetical protein